MMIHPSKEHLKTRMTLPFQIRFSSISTRQTTGDSRWLTNTAKRTVTAAWWRHEIQAFLVDSGEDFFFFQSTRCPIAIFIARGFVQTPFDGTCADFSSMWRKVFDSSQGIQARRRITGLFPTIESRFRRIISLRSTENCGKTWSSSYKYIQSAN